MQKTQDKRHCPILNSVCPEKTDGEATYCNYYCQLYLVYRDYERNSEEIANKEDEDAKA